MGFIYCVNCGNMLDEDALFCGLCGTEVGAFAGEEESARIRKEKEEAERKASEEKALRAVAEAAKREAERKEAERKEAERKEAERKKAEAADTATRNVKMNSRSAVQTIPICSFCGKTQDEVNWLIRGNQAYICENCVDSCAELIEQKREESGLNVRKLRKFSSSPSSSLFSSMFEDIWSNSDGWADS